MKDRIIDYISKHGLIEKGDTVLIALSGGADSVFLFHFLLEIRDRYSLTLKAAHIEHGIRGEESLSDCRFVESLCAEHGVECFTLHIDAKKEARQAGIGVEEYSRNRRYEFFNSIECDKTATAHNLTDNAETLLFRLARGTGLKGACGIPVKRGKIIRPLLCVSGDEIREYLDGKGIPYCVDNTNKDNSYSRNLIRNSVFPLLKQINPDAQAAFARFIESVSQDSACLEAQAQEAASEIEHGGALDIDKLKKYPAAVSNRVIMNYFAGMGAALNDFHLEKVNKLLNAPARTQISGDLFAVSDKNTLRLVSLPDCADKEEKSFSFETSVYSRNNFLNKCELSGKRFDFYCDCDKIIGSVQVRSRREGDSISPAGRNCTKTLKKLFNELKIPAESRGDIPVIADGGGVIGVYGRCVDERVKADKATRSFMVVKVLTEDNI